MASRGAANYHGEKCEKREEDHESASGRRGKGAPRQTGTVRRDFEAMGCGVVVEDSVMLSALGKEGKGACQSV